MELKDAFETLKGNPEITASLEEALIRNAGADELTAILVNSGLSAKDAESAVAEYQRKRGAIIAAQELDDDALDQVAGGGTGVSCSSADDCDNHLKDSKYWNDRCEYFHVCDEFYGK